MEQRHSKRPLLWSWLRVSVCQQPSASTFLATQNLQLHTITYGHGCWVCSMYVWHRQCLIWEQYYTLPTYLRDHRASSRPLLVWTSDICTCHVAPRSTIEHLQEERLDKSVWDSTWPILSHQRTPYPRMYVCTFIILALVREKCHKRPQKVAQVTVCLRSEHHAVFIGCQHQRCPHYCLRQGMGATLSLENAPVLFEACPLCGFPTYNFCSTVENNGQK